jgi:signal transduction histidine kinase
MSAVFGMLIADPHIPARLAIVEGVSVTAHACGNDGSSSPARGIAETLNPGPDRGDSRTGHWMRTSPRKAAPPGYSIARTSPAAELGISLTETEATLAAFDRFVGGGAAVFLILAIAGGLFLSRQALRPVAESIRAARRLDPENLSERLPRTGAGDELDELAATFNGLLDRLAAYHAQIIRFTADASHELRGPLGAMLRVKDTGIGIPAAHLPHLFERFHQADSARSTGGCGLGLSICRWIVKAHGGTIEARNGEVNGAEFTVVLPLENVTSSRPETASIIANSEGLR